MIHLCKYISHLETHIPREKDFVANILKSTAYKPEKKRPILLESTLDHKL